MNSDPQAYNTRILSRSTSSNLLSKSIHFCVVRGMLKRMAIVGLLGDDGVMDGGVHTIAPGRRKISNIFGLCGVKEISANKLDYYSTAP